METCKHRSPAEKDNPAVHVFLPSEAEPRHARVFAAVADPVKTNPAMLPILGNGYTLSSEQ